MPQSSIFRWRDGAGWLVLAGGGALDSDEASEIDGHVLLRTVSHGPLAYLWSAGDIEDADRFLEYVRDLGGRTGYLLDVLSEKDDDTLKQLGEAGIIVLGEGPQYERLHSALTGPVLTAIQNAYNNGATIYARGEMVMALAGWMPTTGGNLQPGIGWLDGALVMAPYSDKQSERMKSWLKDVIPDSYGIGIGQDAALALSPDGEIEIWGKKAVTVLLGQNLSPT
jgi:hypothetical protein